MIDPELAAILTALADAIDRVSRAGVPSAFTSEARALIAAAQQPPALNETLCKCPDYEEPHTHTGNNV